MTTTAPTPLPTLILSLVLGAVFANVITAAPFVFAVSKGYGPDPAWYAFPEQAYLVPALMSATATVIGFIRTANTPAEDPPAVHFRLGAMLAFLSLSLYLWPFVFQTLWLTALGYSGT